MEIVIVSIVLLVGVIYGYYTVSGSGIAEHPYRQAYSDAPGAFGPGSASGRDASTAMLDFRSANEHDLVGETTSGRTSPLSASVRPLAGV